VFVETATEVWWTSRTYAGVEGLVSTVFVADVDPAV
jgi:hypothetical protein